MGVWLLKQISPIARYQCNSRDICCRTYPNANVATTKPNEEGVNMVSCNPGYDLYSMLQWCIDTRAMTEGYAQNAYGENTIEYLGSMQQEGMKLNQFTFSSVLNTCGSLASLQWDKQIHTLIIEVGLESDVSMGSNLVDMYAKCKIIEDPHKDALKLFRQVQQAGIKPNQFTFVNVLRDYASLRYLDLGKCDRGQVHAYVIKIGLELGVYVGSSLVDIKCGIIEDARQVFEISKQAMVSWNAMIVGYAQHGHAMEDLKIFEQMQLEGMQLDHITFIGVLSACSHVGLLNEVHHFFDSLS
eukprot:Gb_32301 [translate_table: standard]